MKEIVMQKEIKELIIEGIHDMRELVTSLINSGYEVTITPVYEELDKNSRYRPVRPRIKHYLVSVGEKMGEGEEQ